MEKNKINERPESYPRPTQTDNQVRNQPEFIDDQPNDFREKEVRNDPSTEPLPRHSEDSTGETR